MRVHWFYTAHDQDTSLVYATKKAQASRPAGRGKGKGKGKGKAAAAQSVDDNDEEGDEEAEQEDEAAPVDTKGKVYRMGEGAGRARGTGWVRGHQGQGVQQG